ncbi:unnamed protein product [Rotaria sp. Silwood2]|nr:unnamed protein product [Rotaria sp. Silwood2]CAF4479900.1 unnamed protein product [Rotaria sp. Silwood2]CAF4525861.1 unnamed protein product [Rotaria sp. Silwood2]
MPTSNTTASNILTTLRVLNSRLLPPVPIETTTKKSPVRQSYLFGIIPSSPPVILATTTVDIDELMKKIDYFIRKSVFDTNSGSVLVQKFNLSDVHLLCILIFIKRFHLFCLYQIGVGGNNASLANTGLTLLKQHNLLVPLKTLKRFIEIYISKKLIFENNTLF